MLEPRWIIGFSGHRKDFELTAVATALRQTLAGFKERITACGGRAEVCSSIAEGADTICVELARELDLAVHVVLPVEEGDFRTDFDDAAAWDRSRRQITLSHSRPGRDTVRVVIGERIRPACYFDTGMWILEACDVLVAVWDGLPARGLGGTAEVVVQARRIGKPLIWVHSKTGGIQAEGLSEAWPGHDPVISELKKLAVGSGVACASPITDPQTLKSCLDEVANREAPRFRRLVVQAIVLHAVAALLAAFAGFFKWTPLTATELVLVLWALAIMAFLQWRHTHEHWLRARFAVEMVRSLSASVPALDPLRPLISHHAPEWSRFAVSAGLLVNAGHPGPDDLDTLRTRYIADRLDDQIHYFQVKVPPARALWKLSRRLAETFTIAAPFFVFIALLNKLLHWGWDQSLWGVILVEFMPIALPLLASAATGVRSALDTGRRTERYPQMAEQLAAAKVWLGGLRTRSTIQPAIARCEEILLDELIEWDVATRSSGAH